MPQKIFGKIKKNSRILILTHTGCDVDAFASAGAIYFSLKHRFRITIGVPDHLNVYAKALAQKLQIPFTINPRSMENFDCLLLVDFNSYKMLGSMEQSVRECKKNIFLIDHHSKSADKITKNSIILPEAVASAEIVFELLEKEKIKIPPKAAACIAAGITADSAGFMVADHETFALMAKAMRAAKKPFSEINSLFQVEEGFSEKVAKLKAAKRVRIFKVNNFIVATTRVGCFEADAATALARLGADIAFAGDLEEHNLKISGRARSEFVRQNGFDLAKHVFEPLEKYFSGSGGGHAGAAAFTGTADSIEAVLQKCLELTQEFAKSKFGNADTKEYE